MGSEARATTVSTQAPEVVAAAVEQVLLGEKCTITGKAADGSTIDFTTRKTMLAWELEGQIVTSPTPEGSRIDLMLNTHHNRPTALMDGMKNEKSAKKLMAKIAAVV